MASVDDVLRIARGDVGITETPPNSNRVILRDGTNLWVSIVGRDVRGWAWCGAWVTSVFRRAGMGDQVDFTYCPTGRVAFMNRHSLHDDPQPGDVSFYDWEGDSIVDHTGIVVRVNRSLITRRVTSVTVLEGNTLAPGRSGNQSDGGGVFERERPIGACRGFGRPNYSGPIHAQEADDLTGEEHKLLDETRKLAQAAVERVTVAQASAGNAYVYAADTSRRLTALEAKIDKLLKAQDTTTEAKAA